jgi:hypothetical protein
MLLDSLLQICDPQAITDDAISEHVIDLGPLGPVNVAAGAAANTIRDIGAGEPLHLSVVVTTAFVSAGGAGLVVTLESDSVVGLDSSATVHWTSGAALLSATLVAGYWIAKGILVPPGNYERYLGLRFEASTSTFSAGAVKAWLHKGRFDDRTYESGFSTGVN